MRRFALVTPLLLLLGCEPATPGEVPTAGVSERSSGRSGRQAEAAEITLVASTPPPIVITQAVEPETIDEEIWRERVRIAAADARDAIRAFELRWLQRLEESEAGVYAEVADARDGWFRSIDGDLDLRPTLGEVNDATLDAPALAAAVGRVTLASDELESAIGGDLEELRAQLIVGMREELMAMRAEQVALSTGPSAVAMTADEIVAVEHIVVLREAWSTLATTRAETAGAMLMRFAMIDELIAEEIERVRYELTTHLADVRGAALRDYGIPAE